MEEVRKHVAHSSARISTSQIWDGEQREAKKNKGQRKIRRKHAHEKEEPGARLCDANSHLDPSALFKEFALEDNFWTDDGWS